MSTMPVAQQAELGRLQRLSVGVGVATLLPCVVGAFFSPGQFFRAYLAAYQFYLGLGLGCMVILMVYHLTGGAWGFLIRKFLEAGVATLPLLAILFAPIAYGVGYLYLWAQPPDKVAVYKILQHQRIYSNPPFFWIRAACYFVLWMTIAWLLTFWSRRQDETGNPRWVRWQSRLSGPGLAIYGVTITFASVDWVMSLQPAFHSTIFGPLVASGHLVSAMAFVIILMAWLVARPPLANYLSLEALNDLGNLAFTFLIMWAYMAYFQFMLIWIANLPADVIWYLDRSQGGWQWVAWALFIFHFAIPFFLLLMRDIKRDPASLARVAALLLFMHLVYAYFQVMPSFPDQSSLGQHWMDFLTPTGIGGLWLAYYLYQLRRRPLLPRHDSNQEAAIHLRDIDEEAAARQEGIGHG